MSSEHWLVEAYFDQLRSECFSEVSERREYEGVLRVLHDIPFYWTILLDEDRAGDALSYRQHDFLGYFTDLSQFDQRWLSEWAQQTPSVLEVMLGMARRWHDYFEGSIPFYFAKMFLEMRFHYYPGRRLSKTSEQQIRKRVDIWLSRQFEANGDGSPFPVRHIIMHDENGDLANMTKMDMKSQMNAYSLEHFQ